LHKSASPSAPDAASAALLLAVQRTVPAAKRGHGQDDPSAIDFVHADETASAGMAALQRARAFAEPLLVQEHLSTGENSLAHADAVAALLRDMGGAASLQAACYLVYACPYLKHPGDILAKAFGADYAQLAVQTNQLVAVQRQAAQAAQASDGVGQNKADAQRVQTENVRKMLLAFGRDLRVVLLRLASRLQTLRWYAQSKTPVPPDWASETLAVFAPLANRLGLWQIKWELEDLAFRFLEPETYKSIASQLDAKRSEREAAVAQLRDDLTAQLHSLGLTAEVQGRPKHIYSIVKKMRGKALGFERVFDLQALRVVVGSVDDCYKALAHIHQWFAPIDSEYKDYIARPKANGYESLHTVVRDAAGKPIEVQIRSHAMHAHAEHGVAAHWAYKEAGAKGYAGVNANSSYDAKIAVLRQLLAWERELSAPSEAAQALFDDRIYVLTPDAAVLELPRGATAIDLAYAVHTNLGHRCRGAKVDGALVTLSTPLKNGQTVEIVAAKEGGATAASAGPSRDWLNPELGFMASSRARTKVRAWFNAQAAEQTTAKGREAVEKLLQREGRTAIKLDDLAGDLGFKSADELFMVVGKDEFSLRHIETLLNPPEAALPVDEHLLLKTQAKVHSSKHRSGVLVVGVGSLLTQLARCCKPAPPDAIGGFVTRGKGVSVHRVDCSDFKHLCQVHSDRVIGVDWGEPPETAAAKRSTPVYPVDVLVLAHDRQALLRDISEVFSKEKMNVIAVQTSSKTSPKTKNQAATAGQTESIAHMTFTVQVSNTQALDKVLHQVAKVAGVLRAERR
jgi:GTP pyrophosphokinase